MGINMFLPEVNEQTISVQRMCHSYIEGMELVKEQLNNFINETRLNGLAYDSAKQYFSTAYIPLADGIILLSEEIINAHERFPEKYTSEVDSNSLQSHVLEHQIQQLNQQIHTLQDAQRGYPIINLPLSGMIGGLRFLRSKLNEKLHKLITFHHTSSDIFSEIDSILVDVEAGLREVSSGRSWNATNGRFDTSRLDMGWSNNIGRRTFNSELDTILNKVPDLDRADLNRLLDLAEENPDAEIPASFLEYLQENSESIGVDVSQDLISALIEQSGLGVIRLGGLANVITGMPGPVGSNSFVLLNPRTTDVINTVIKHGRNLQGVGTAIGVGFMAFGYGIGMYDDLINNDKTVGEALAHNTTSLGVGIAGSTIGASVTASLLISFGVSNPVGWAILGSVAVGVFATWGFNYLYDNNIGNVQDDSDRIGRVIDYTLKKAGKAIINHGLFINPISWAW